MDTMKKSASFLAVALALTVPGTVLAAGGKHTKVKPAAPPAAEPEPPAPEPEAAPEPAPVPQVAQADQATDASVRAQAPSEPPEPDPTQNLGGVLVRMPPSAFPEPRTRG